jgi:hypothetical protein
LGLFSLFILPRRDSTTSPGPTPATDDLTHQTPNKEKKRQPATMGGGGTGGAGGFYDAALQKRQAMMGKSGPSALIKNFRVFRIALFACIGGVMYGYNQGMFSGVLAMPAFNKRRFFLRR